MTLEFLENLLENQAFATCPPRECVMFIQEQQPTKRKRDDGDRFIYFLRLFNPYYSIIYII